MASAPVAVPMQPRRADTAHALAAGLASLTLKGFRNYDDFSLVLGGESSPAPQFVVLTGPNGAGKTNLMEAVSLLAPGRGLRRAKSVQFCHRPYGYDGHGNGHAPSHADASLLRGWGVSAQIITGGEGFRAGTGMSDEDVALGKSRSVRIDGAASSQNELGTRLAVAWLTPDMDQVLAASPSRRRQFLDRLVIAFDPAHNGRLARYEKAARERARLLDDGGGDEEWFTALEAEMAASGAAIVAARKSLTEALDSEASIAIPVFPRARLRLTGEAEAWLDQYPALAVEDRIRDAAAAARRRGEKVIPGPAASLLIATHPDSGADAEMCSTGEQKALVISVVLAHARLQAKRLERPPVLLLDDIASHLDAAARHALFDLAGDLQGQVWFSSTDYDLFAPVHGRARHVVLGGNTMQMHENDNEHARSAAHGG